MTSYAYQHSEKIKSENLNFLRFEKLWVFYISIKCVPVKNYSQSPFDRFPSFCPIKETIKHK